MIVKRPILVRGDVAIVPLTKGKRALIDSRDVSLVDGWNWHAKQRRNRRWYALSTFGRKMLYMHRVILQPPDELETDHINHDGLDNRRNNLRACTRSENMANGRYTVTSSSKFRGVYWDKRRCKWHARISRKRVHLGRFVSEVEAARAYDDAALELYGEFASPNFPCVRL